MARTRKRTGFDFSQPFDTILREVFRRAERGAGAEARRFFDSLLRDLDAPSRIDGMDRIPEPYRVLGVLPDAPRFIVEAAYRAWAKSTHPDPSWQTDTRKICEEHMVKINAAVAAIRKARGWK